MALWDRIKQVLGREKRELADVARDLEERASSALDARERELNATPEERLAMEQQRTEEIDAEFEAVKRRIEGGGA